MEAGNYSGRETECGQVLGQAGLISNAGNIRQKWRKRLLFDPRASLRRSPASSVARLFSIASCIACSKLNAAGRLRGDSCGSWNLLHSARLRASYYSAAP